MGTIDFHRRRLHFENNLPNFGVNGINRVFTMFKTSIHTLEYAILIYTSSDPADRRYVFWDVMKGISLNSKVSTTTTPTTTTLGEFIIAQGVSNVHVHTLFYSDGYSMNISGYTGVSTFIYYNDALLDHVYLLGNADSIFKGGAFSELDEGNNYSIYVEISSEDTNVLRGVFSTVEAGGGSGSRYTMYVDRGGSRYIDIIRNTSSNNFFGNYLATQNNSLTRVIGTSVNGGTKEKKSYLNGVLQDTENYTGTYDNSEAVVGAILGNGIPVKGKLRSIVVCDEENSEAQANEIFNLLTA